MVDFVADYLENIDKRRVVPSVEPGYLRPLIARDAPEKPETFSQVMEDVDRLIMPGAASPACTELETIVLQWFGQMIGLPAEFLPFTENCRGGGVIQGSASECILVALLAARHEAIKKLKSSYPFVEDGVLLSKLIAYCSKEAHSSVEKACMIGLVKVRILDTNEKYELTGECLQTAIVDDRRNGMVPFFVSTTLGTTSCCSFDRISEIGPICERENIWMHVDAAYAGSAFICPEFKHFLKGIEYAMSFNTNPNKWMLVNFDCSTMWVKDRFRLTQALVIDPLYLQHSYMDQAIDYRHWGIPLSRRFRSLKLWFVIRMYGIEGLQTYIREHCRLAKRFEQLMRADRRFDIVGEVHMGLVCFRLKAQNSINKRLLSSINASGELHMVPCSLDEKYVIRFCVCAERASDRDIVIAADTIKRTATQVLGLHSFAFHTLQIANGPAMMFTNHALSCEREGSGDVDAIVDDVMRDDEEEEVEQQDKLTKLVGESLTSDVTYDDYRHLDAKHRRSFFVRMVSDPKNYNPKIALNLTGHQERILTDETSRATKNQGPSTSGRRRSDAYAKDSS